MPRYKEKNIFLSIVFFSEVRRFQLYAQIELVMHKENLYEFLHYIRRNSILLDDIKQTANNIKDEEPMTKHSILVKHLDQIKKTSDFVCMILFLTKNYLVFFRKMSDTNQNRKIHCYTLSFYFFL